jgi:hypothetical protein
MGIIPDQPIRADDLIWSTLTSARAAATEFLDVHGPKVFWGGIVLALIVYNTWDSITDRYWRLRERLSRPTEISMCATKK